MRARLAAIASVLALAVAGAQSPSRVFVVVFDEQHLSSGGLKRLQAAAVALFTKEFQPGDLGGVVVDGQLVSGRLLSDRGDVLKGIGRAHPASRRRPISSLQRQCREASSSPRASRRSRRSRPQRAATDRKLSILETLVGNLARVDGRKAVLLMSDGFGGDASSPRVRALITAAERAGVRFHVLDESGGDRDAANGLARGTAGIVARRANTFASSIERIGKDTVAVSSGALPR